MNSESITVSLGDRSYDVHFGPDIYPFFQEWICRFYPGGSVFVLTDRNVASIYLDDIRRWLSGIPNSILELPAGEESKGLDTVRRIYSFLAGGGADRDSLVVAFGGGVVGDLAGFAAATYLRGIPFVQVPTTLLSQVDSSVGGKTGFNLPEGKNLVGAFHQPRAVFVDHTFLRTLDDRNVQAGLAEIVKCALAGDAAMWDRLRHDGARWREFGGSDWQWLTKRSVAFKAAVVEADEKEASVRKVLNLGHTVGHAFEQASGYGRLLHGEAVAMGLCWEAILGRRMGITPPEFEERIFTLLLDMGYALDDPEIPVTSLASAVGQDKKRANADVVLPLLTDPGRFTLERVPLARLRGELPGIRAEIRERVADREAGGAGDPAIAARIGRGELPEVVAELEARVAASPFDLPTLALLASAYRMAGNLAAARETIREVLARNPSDIHAQRLAREIESAGSEPGIGPPSVATAAVERTLVLEEGAFELRPADLPEEFRDAPVPPAETAEAVPGAGAVPVPAPEPEPFAESPAEAFEEEPYFEDAIEPAATAGWAADARPSQPDPGEAPAGEPGPVVAFDEAGCETYGEERYFDEVIEPASGETAEVPPVMTITMANLYWEQGDRETALAIVDGILAADPADARAIEWKASRIAAPRKAAEREETALGAFLERIRREYGHGLSRDH